MSGVEALIAAMLHDRGAGKTLCPSEVARALAEPDGDWRGRMSEVHSGVDRMLAVGSVALSWQGAPMAQRSGPYRIALPE